MKELFMSPFLPDESIKFIKVNDGTWPLKTKCLCFNCSEKIQTPIPAVDFFSNGVYTVYPYYFCSAGCSLAWIRDSLGMDPRKEMLTKKLFQLCKIQHQDPFPPRCMLDTFGGPLTLSQYRQYPLEFVTLQSPPFVTYSMFSEFRNKHQDTSLFEVSRPTERSLPLTEKTETGKSPLLLDFIAKKYAEIEETLPKTQNLKNFCKRM